MTNQEYIDLYKNSNAIIMDYYKFFNTNKYIDVKDIVNPLKIDNRQLVSPTDDQKTTPHCAAYAAAELIESIYWKYTGKLLQFDAHQIYANAKIIDGYPLENGTYIEIALKTVLKLCKYDSKFAFLNKNNISIEKFFNTNNDKTIVNIKHLIHKHNFLICGFNIDEGWYECNNSSYIIRQTGNILGGHAVVLCGYNNIGFFIHNQWSQSWGSKGFAIIPYEIFLKQFLYCCFMNFAS